MSKQVKIESELKGQFPSKNCECHMQEPYGFVPEADCAEHDTRQFQDFLEVNDNKLLKEEVKLLKEEIAILKEALCVCPRANIERIGISRKCPIHRHEMSPYYRAKNQ